MKGKILVLGDTHTGSPVGLRHPHYVDVDGVLVGLTGKQDYLWDNYIRLLDKLPTDISDIVFNGDAIDGKPNKRNDDEAGALHRSEDQIAAAIMTLEEVRSRLPKAKWHFVVGTPNHEKPAEVRTIARHFTTEIPELSYPGKFGKARLLFHHEVGHTSGYQKSGPLEREFVRGYINVAKHGDTFYHAQIRSHVHYHYYTGDRNVLSVSVPCFQLATPFTKKGTPHSIPDLGFLILHIDDSNLDRGMCPVSFEPCLFPTPLLEMGNEMGEINENVND